MILIWDCDLICNLRITDINRLRLRLHRFNFWCICSLQTCLYNACTSKTNWPSGVWALQCIYVL